MFYALIFDTYQLLLKHNGCRKGIFLPKEVFSAESPKDTLSAEMQKLEMFFLQKQKEFLPKGHRHTLKFDIINIIFHHCYRNHQRYKTRFKKMMNQKWWINYSGLKFGDVHNPYKTKYPF